MAVETHQPIRMCILISYSLQRDSVARAPRLLAPSDKTYTTEQVDHLVHHHEASTRDAVSAIIRQQPRDTGP